MKRIEHLRALSSDHHHALALARLARRTAVGKEPIGPDEMWQEVIDRFRRDLSRHFAIEEKYLLPEMKKAGQDELVERTLDDHKAIGELVASKEGPTRWRLAAFGAMLNAHVKFEENELFEKAQECLPDEALEVIAKAHAEIEDGRD
ncbi:MAG: hemerythrin domain-containing protein [Deltaproteobacteria bacterium]|nr:hemerythrin domain-containing protein [bacterium]MCB9476709.1 hemerythrin domain-containing protein [Deltaproteobacteria bacterium]MCB9488892.1 hemerythrin domain-containing protein [Deltaproteobacteria bacterium]